MADQQDKTASTVADIAASLFAPTAPAEEVPLEEGNEVEVEVVEEEPLGTEADSEDDTDIPLEEGNDDEDEDEVNEAGDDDAAEDAGEFEFLDTDMLEVKIDGQIHQRSIADAKKALSGEGAIEKRLKEATELRKAVQATHTQQLEQFGQDNQTLIDTMSQIHGVVFKPQVAKPPASLRQSNPTAYLQQVDAYDADQLRVKDGTEMLSQMVQQRQAAQQKSMDAYRVQQAEELVRAIPAFGDHTHAQEILPKMAKFAMDNYGYTADEIQGASDHRMYRMVHDLMKMQDARDPVKRKASTVKNLDGQASKRPRMLRSGGTSRKTAAVKQTEQAQRTATNARKTGKVKDVAQTLIK